MNNKLTKRKLAKTGEKYTIYKYDKNLKLIKKYKSVKIASEDIGHYTYKIYKSLNSNLTIMCDGCYWSKKLIQNITLINLILTENNLKLTRGVLCNILFNESSYNS